MWSRGRAFARITLATGDEVAATVAAIEIGAEGDEAVRLGPGGDVSEVDRQRTGQVYVQSLAGIQHFFDAAWLIPADFAARDPFDEFEHALHADAAGAEGASALIEQLLHRRVMHVDPFRVRHVDTHEAKGVLRTWVLLELDLGVVGLGPVDCPRIKLLRRVGSEDADALLLEILGLLAQLQE